MIPLLRLESSSYKVFKKLGSHFLILVSIQIWISKIFKKWGTTRASPNKSRARSTHIAFGARDRICINDSFFLKKSQKFFTDYQKGRKITISYPEQLATLFDFTDGERVTIFVSAIRIIIK